MTLSIEKNFPKDHKQNLAWRREMLIKAMQDKMFKKDLQYLFYENVIFAFNAFFYTYDVRLTPNHNVPFTTFPFQDQAILEIVQAVNEKYDILIEKSRDEGISWIVLLTYLWFWLNPQGGGDFLLGSRKEQYVDRKGDMRTLFEKLRYTLKRLPAWLKPKDFGPRHDGDCKLINPQTSASITGESNNEAFSTAGRYRGVLFDEFAKWKYTDVLAWTSAGDATPSRCAISTANGTTNQFFALLRSGKTKVLSFYWYLDPRKNEGAYCAWPKPKKPPYATGPWREAEIQRRSKREVAQEIDGNYIGAGFNVFADYTEYINELMQRKPLTEEKYAFNAEKEEFELLSSSVENTEDFLIVYERPQKDKTYIISCDPAEGGEKADYSVIKVLCRETRSCVATWASKLYDEVILAKMFACVWLMYTTSKDAVTWWAVETTGIGLAVFDLCIEKHRMYRGAFLMPRVDTVTSKVSYRKGWWTSTTSRRALIGSIKEWLHDQEGWLDPRCLGEMLTFEINTAGRSEARKGMWDDDLMAFGIALQVDELVGGHRRVKANKENREKEMLRQALEQKDEEHPVQEYYKNCVRTAREATIMNKFLNGGSLNDRTTTNNYC